MNRLQQILGGLLVVQIALALFTFWPRGSAESVGALFDFKTDDITSVTLVNPAPNGKEVTLTKQGDKWILPNAGDFEAKASSITEVIGKIAKINGSRLVANSSSSQRRLKVAEDEFERKVVMKSADGKEETLYVGTSPSAGALHVRRSGQDATYLTNAINSWELDAAPNRWITTTYVTLDTTQISSIELSNANGKWLFTRGANDAWQTEGISAEQFNSNTFTTMLNALAALAINEPLGKEAQDSYQLGSQAKIVITLKDGKSQTVEIGALSADSDGYYAKYSESPYYVTINKFSGDGFADKKQTDFINTPTPAP